VVTDNKGFLDKLSKEKIERSHTTKGLKLERLLDELKQTNEQLVSEMEIALKDSTYSYDIVATVMKDYGIDISASGVRRWRVKYGIVER
jgi:hypothetical protein